MSDGAAPFPKLMLADAELCLKHLHPKLLIVETQSRPKGVGIFVQFSTHCFTEDHDPIRHGADVPTLLDDRRQLRAYCPERYKLSKDLPDLIWSMAAQKVFLTPEANYMRLGARADGMPGEYRAYFNLKRATRIKGADLRLYVESAYSPDPVEALPVSKHQTVRFKVLVDTVLMGKAVKFNPKR